MLRNHESGRVTYSLILHLLSLAALERNAVALVLQALRSNQTLDTRSLGVWLLALALGLDLTTDNVLADLLPGKYRISLHVSSQTLPQLSDRNRHRYWAGDDGVLA